MYSKVLLFDCNRAKVAYHSEVFMIKIQFKALILE